MKKTGFFFIAGLLALASCTESSFTYDMFGFDNTDATSIRQVYLDQDIDTLGNIVSTKSWTATASADWIQLGKTSQNVSSGTTSTSYIPISYTTNDADSMREAYIVIRNTDNETIGRTYQQLYYLNITHPVVQFTDVTTKKGASFTLNPAYNATSDSIKINLYAPSATITGNAEWVTPNTTTIQKAENSYQESKTVYLTLQNNPTYEERTATITITTSTGRTSTVLVKQAGRDD